MKRLSITNLLSFMMLIFFVSCNENESLDTNHISDTGFINFGLSEASTKTSYDAADKLRINWENGDKVKVSCEQSQGVKESVYEVVQSTIAANEGTLRGTSSSLLKWNTNAVDHTFYGAYPGESATINGSQITCKCEVNQTLIAAGDNVYTPDMKNACMVAASTAMQTTSSVKLNFVPAFTALDIEIPVSATNSAVALSSLTITLDNRLQYISPDGEFILDCSDLANGYTFTTYSGAPLSIGFSANIPAPITIEAGKKAVITLLLPPITVEANSATITAVLDGTTKTTGINTEIAGGTRRTIKMGELQPAPSVDRIEIIPANDTNLVNRPYTLGDTITLKYGLTQQLKAIAHYSNGTIEDVTSDAGTRWSYAVTAAGAGASAVTASVGNTTEDKGLVTLIKVGTSKITATYKGVSDTAYIKPKIHRIFTNNNYCQWDAQAPYDPDKMYEGFGYGLSGYNDKDNVSDYDYSSGEAMAKYLCADAPTVEEVMAYLGNGVFYSNNDGLIFTISAGGGSGMTLFCRGIWLMKQNSDGWDPVASADSVNFTTSNTGRPSNSVIDNYFFLPACGYYNVNIFSNAATGARYWLSTPGPINVSSNRYCYGHYLEFFSTYKYVVLNKYYRDDGYVPMPCL